MKKKNKNAGGQFSVSFLIFSLLFLFHRKNLYAETCMITASLMCANKKY